MRLEPIDMSAGDERHFKNATHCRICGYNFKSTCKNKKDELNNREVRDHCHFTGRYRGCTHPVCNLNWCNKYFEIPVIFRNVKNYDNHFIIQNANRFRRSDEINVIAQNSEKFLTLGLEHLSIKDCFSVLSSSSEKLVNLNRYEEGSKREKLQDNLQHSMSFCLCKFWLRFRFTNWKRCPSIWLYEFAANCLKKKPVRKIMTERWRHSTTLIWKIWETTAICI